MLLYVTKESLESHCEDMTFIAIFKTTYLCSKQ